MASVKCKILIHIKNKTVPKTLKSSDWNENYKILIEYVERKANGTHLQHFHMIVEQSPIDSFETFKQAIMNKMQQKEIRVYIKDGPPMKSQIVNPNGIKCVIHCDNQTSLEWFYDKDENSDESTNYANFNAFLSNKLNVDAKCMKIYHVENGNDLVEDEGDFGSYFEDVDVGSGKQVDFRVQLLSGYIINVDLNETDCKEDFQFTIPKTDLNNETEWMESWQEILTQIGKTLKNNEWEKQFSLVNKKTNTIINKKLEDFINVFRNGERNNNIHFFLQVEKCFARKKKRKKQKSKTARQKKKNKGKKKKKARLITAAGNANDSFDMNGKRLFLIEKDGSTVSWCPDDVEVQNSSKLWKSLVRHLKRQFKKINVIDDKLKYHPSKNTIKMVNNSNNNNNNELNKSNIENYCNLLRSSNNSIRMYFYVGNDAPPADVYDDLKANENENGNGKRAIIVTSKLIGASKEVVSEVKKQGGKVVNAQITINLGDDENDDDWDKFYEKITQFLNQLYQVNDDSLEYDDYDEFPYQIYQIEQCVWNNPKNKISQQAQSGDLSEFDQFLTKYSLDIELDEANALEEYFDVNDTSRDCILFVTYKEYLVMVDAKSKKVFHWSPSYLELKKLDNDNGKNVNWDKEFASMKSETSKCFNLLDNDKLTFVRTDDNTDMEAGDDIEEIWQELTGDDAVATVKVTVDGEPQAGLVDKPKIGPVAADRRFQMVNHTSKRNIHHGEEDEKWSDELDELDFDFDFDGPVLIPLDSEIKDDFKQTVDSAKRDVQILLEIDRIDQALIDMNMNESSAATDIDKELEFICDNLRKRQKCVSALQNEKFRETTSQGREELLTPLEKRLNWLISLISNNEDYNDKSKIVEAVKRAYDICVNHGDLSLTSRELVKAMKQVRAFDIEETIILFEKTMEASKSVKDKDICLLLGKTGAGKSTTIHFLAGSEMVKDASTGHIGPRKGGVINHHLKNVKTEWTVTESVTRYIADVPIKLSDFGVEVGYGSFSKNLITLCDAPGFDDSGGPEIDVANGLGIVYGVSQARAAKILLVLTKANLDERMKGIKDVSHTLSKIFPNFSKHLSSVDVIFTKMDITKIQLKNKINKAIEELDGKDNDDVAFLTLLHHIQKLDDTKLIFLNPVPEPSSRAAEIRRELLQILFDSSASWIHRPSEQFKKFVTQSSLAAIDQQLLLHEAAIRKAVTEGNIRGGDKKTNYQLIGTKIGQLRKLQQLLDSKNIGECLSSCNKIVLKTWNQRCEDAKKQLAISSKSRSLEEFQIDVNSYKAMLAESKECEMLQKELTKQREISEKQRDDKNENGELLMTSTESLKLTLDTQMKYLVNHCTLDLTSEIYFRKAQTIVNVFGKKYETIYNDKLNQLLNEINDLEIKTAKMIDDNNDFQDIYRNFCQLDSMTHLNDIFGSNTVNISPIIRKLEQHLIKHLTKDCDFIKQTFDIDMGGMGNVRIIRKDVIEKCGKHMSALKDAQRTFGSSIQNFGNNNNKNNNNNSSNDVYSLMEKLHNDGVAVIVEFCSNHRRIIEDLLAGNNDAFRIIANFGTDSDSGHSGNGNLLSPRYGRSIGAVNDENYDHQQLEQYVGQLSKVRKLSIEVEMKTSGIYYQTIEFVFRCFDNDRKIFDQMVDKIENNEKCNIKYGELVRIVRKLRNCEWLSKYRDQNEDNDSNTFENSEILNKIEIKLKMHVRTLLQDANGLYVDIRDGAKVKQLKQMMSDLKELRKLDALLTGLANEIDEVAAVLQSEVVEKLFEINNYCQTNSLENGFASNENINDDNNKNSNNKKNKSKNSAQKNHHQRNYLPPQWLCNVLDFLEECDSGTWFDHIDVKIGKIHMTEKLNGDNSEDNNDENKDDRKDECQDESQDESKDDTMDDRYSKHVRKQRGRIKIRKEIGNTLSIVKEFVKNYGTLRMREMENAFDYLCDTSAGSGINVMENGILLSDCLREFNNFDLNYPAARLMEYLIPDSMYNEAILTQMHEKLIEQHGNLEVKLNNMVNGKDPRLQIGVLHAHAFSKCDWFLRGYNAAHRKNDPGHQFRRLYVDFGKKAEPNPECHQIKTLIDNGDFDSVNRELNRIKETIDVGVNVNTLKQTYDRAQHILFEKLTNTIDEIQTQIIKVKSLGSGGFQKTDVFAAVKELSQSLDVFTKGTSKCLHHVSSKQKQQRLSNLHLQMQQLLGQLMDQYTQTVSASITSNDFVKVEEGIQNIQTMQQLLGKYLVYQAGNNNFDADQEHKQQQEKTPIMLSYEETVVEALKQHLKDLETYFIKSVNYATAEKKPYSKDRINPRELYDKLSVLKHEQKYWNLWKKIEKDIRTKFHDEIERCRTVDFGNAQTILTKLKKIVRYLPKYMKNELNYDWKECHQHVKEKQGEKEIETGLEQGDYGKLNEFFWKRRNDGDDEFADKVKYKVKEKLEKRGENIIQSMSKVEKARKGARSIMFQIDSNKLLQDYDEIYYICTDFGISEDGKQLQDIQKYCTNARKSIETKYGEAAKFISKILDTLSIPGKNIMNKNIVDSLNNASQFIRAVSMKDKQRDGLFTNSISDEGNKLVLKVKKYFEDCKAQLGEGIENCNFELVNRVLKSIKWLDPTISKCTLVENLCDIDDAVQINNAIAYTNMVHEVIALGQKIKNEILDESFVGNGKLRFEKDRKIFYSNLRDKLSILKEFDKVKHHTKIDAKKEFIDPCEKHIRKQIEKIERNVNESINDKHFQFTETSLASLNDNYLMLCSVRDSKTLSDAESKSVNETCENVEKKINKKIGELSKKATKNVKKDDVVASSLIDLEMARNVLLPFNDACKAEQDKIFKKFRKAKPNGLAFLRQKLDDNDSPWGSVLCSEHSVFKGQNVSLFNKATQDMKIDDVLTQIRANDGSINKTAIERRYITCNKIYEKIVSDHLDNDLRLGPIVHNIETIAKDARAKMVETSLLGTGYFRTGAWNSDFKERAIHLMAHIFAIWTLQNSKHYFEAGDASDAKSFLMQPRVAQVVSIIRLLSIDDSESDLIRNLVEIGTGEGKSLTLAVASCILALLGFNVSCACYSEYLSRRDYQSFENLFKLLGVTDYISYGTFNELCEQVINEDGNIRQMVEGLVLSKKRKFGRFGKGGRDRHKKKHRRRVLLIDEVDVFFNKEFYGNTYTPGAVIRDNTIKNLTDYIWKNRSSLSYNNVKASAEYKVCQRRFGKWMDLINEAVKDMICDVNEFEGTNYVVKNDQIGYKDSDRISFSKTLGYKTLFTYYHEHSKGNITKASLNQKIAVYLQCGSFSYAEIPKKFDVILGVTGTLETLSRAEQDIMKNTYEISRHTYMPSLFGVKKLEWRPKIDIKMFDEKKFDEQLKEAMKAKMNDHYQPRCVFVCFETKQKLEQFFNSGAFGIYQSDCLILTEQVDKKEKNSIIKRAPTSKKILLLTKAFGRGTDFQVHDKIVRNNGGPHVIQTFLSEQKSEEKQIMGRTARQGGQGSYSMVLIDKELEKYKITLDDIKEQDNNGTMYEFMDKKRFEYFQAEYKENERFVKDAAKSHHTAVRIRDTLKNAQNGDAKSEGELKKLLIEENLGASVGSGGLVKVAVLMDATGSMSGLIQKAKNTVQTMFDQVGEILVDNHKDAKSFQIQFMAYRSYNAPIHLLLEVSGWSNNSTQLRTFLSDIKACYGHGSESVEVALQHCNRLIEEKGDKISCVIIIGDAPPIQNREEVHEKRGRAKYDLSTSPYCAQETFYQDEIIKLKNHDVEVHTYYVDNYAKKEFEWIASNGNGQCHFLDVNSSKGAQTLTEFLSMRVCDSCGGEELVRQYKAKFMHV